MKKIRKMVWLILVAMILLGIGISINRQWGIKTNYFSEEQTSKQESATPTEKLVAYARLRNTYYYKYASKVPPRVKQAFEYAVKVYQDTGIVKLKPGVAPKGQNQVTFGVYDNKKKSNTPGSVEFGHGGVSVRLQIFDGLHFVNNGSANLNLAYVGELSPAVAVHELGHALGLAHSDNIDSIMYPMENGQTALTKEDLKALKEIYE